MIPVHLLTTLVALCRLAASTALASRGANDPNRSDDTDGSDRTKVLDLDGAFVVMKEAQCNTDVNKDSSQDSFTNFATAVKVLLEKQTTPETVYTSGGITSWIGGTRPDGKHENETTVCEGSGSGRYFCKIVKTSSLQMTSGDTPAELCFYAPFGNGYFTTDRLQGQTSTIVNDKRSITQYDLFGGESRLYITQGYDLDLATGVREFYHYIVKGDLPSMTNEFGLFNLQPLEGNSPRNDNLVEVFLNATPKASFHMVKKGMRAGIVKMRLKPRFPNLGFAYGDHTSDPSEKSYFHPFYELQYESNGGWNRKSVVHVYDKVAPPNLRQFILGVPVEVDPKKSRGPLVRVNYQQVTASDFTTHCVLDMKPDSNGKVHLIINCNRTTKQTSIPTATLKTPIAWKPEQKFRQAKALMRRVRRSRLVTKVLGDAPVLAPGFTVVVLPDPQENYVCNLEGNALESCNVASATP